MSIRGVWGCSSQKELAQNLIVNENNIPLEARRLSVITVEKATNEPLQYRRLSGLVPRSKRMISENVGHKFAFCRGLANEACRCTSTQTR